MQASSRWFVVVVFLLSGAFFLLKYPLPSFADQSMATTADPVLVAAGDIANCNLTMDASTADLLDTIAGTVVTLGDNAYDNGTPQEFADCYEPTWGRHKARTKPSTGNHDYGTNGAEGYFTYFGAAASPLDSPCTKDCKGYYSYDLGAWHIIALNSEIAVDENSAQVQWLRADLAAHTNVCTLVYFHRPRFSSGEHGNSTIMGPFWDALYEYGADVVLNGHEHLYERFAPQNPAGQADAARGIRQFIVGTGGDKLNGLIGVEANSEVRNDDTWGVLKLTLHPTSYDWEFVPIAGQTFSDSGSDDCVTFGSSTPPDATGTPPGGVVPTIQVPQDYATIQAAIDAAANDDVIVVGPGTYNEEIVISGKRIILASEFYLTQNRSFIDQTIIDGGGGAAVVRINNSATGTQIIGFTIQNGVDGVDLYTQASILDNRVHMTTDGIDSANGGGLIRGNLVENNQDDGLDFDGRSSATVENNTIRNNMDDGIEIRLHDYTGPRLTFVIRGNTIMGNDEDGIQLIDYPALTDRVITIERNLIQGSTQVGLGLMDNGETVEDYRAASIPERIHVFNNTFVDNPYAITGGDNLIAVNNIFVGSSVMALKNVDGGSVVAYSLFANNAVDSTGSNVVSPTILANPLLDTAFNLLPGSPAIDVGTANYVHNGEMVLSYPPGTYAGSAPDLGWHETSATTDPTPTPTNTPVGVPTPTPTQTPIPTATPTDSAPVTPTATPTSTQGSDDIVFVGSTGKGVAGGVNFADEDILAYDRNNSAWIKYFDGSDTAGSRVDFDSIARLPDGSLLLSLELDETIDPLGLVEDSDIVRFVPSSAGSPTLGIFEWYLDGSDVGLIGDSEDIDGLAVLNDGRLVMSTRGKAAVADAADNSVYAEDEDLLVFTPLQLGQTTAGSWALYFDGSDVGLGVDDGGDEDVREIWIDPVNGDIYLTTQDAFSVPGPDGDISGSNNDIFVCATGSIGDTTSCTFRIYWNGAANGFGDEIIDTLDIGKGTLAQSASLADVLHILDDPGVEGADDVHDDEALDDVPEFQEFMPFVNR